MPDALLIAVAAVVAFAALCSIVLGVWLTAVAAWRERQEKQRRGGLLDFTPGRARLGDPQTRRSRRGGHRPGP